MSETLTASDVYRATNQRAKLLAFARKVKALDL